MSNVVTAADFGATRVGNLREGDMFRKIGGGVIFMMFDPYATPKLHAINLRTGYLASFAKDNMVIKVPNGTEVTIRAGGGGC